MDGVKKDQDKPMYALLSNVAINEVVKVMTFGAQKYSANNWRGGMLWTRLISASLRHIFAWMGGENLDPETKISHLAHAMCCLMFLLEFSLTGAGKDDRFNTEELVCQPVEGSGKEVPTTKKASLDESLLRAAESGLISRSPVSN